MSVLDHIDNGSAGTGDPRRRGHDSGREASSRLPVRGGRRQSGRPAVDPDLEQFLTSAEFKIWPDWNAAPSDHDEVIEPEEMRTQSSRSAFPGRNLAIRTLSALLLPLLRRITRWSTFLRRSPCFRTCLKMPRKRYPILIE